MVGSSDTVSTEDDHTPSVSEYRTLPRGQVFLGEVWCLHMVEEQAVSLFVNLAATGITSNISTISIQDGSAVAVGLPGRKENGLLPSPYSGGNPTAVDISAIAEKTE